MSDNNAFKFCPKCATPFTMRFEGGRERLACPNCSHIHFGEFSIGVGGVVMRDGKALLIRRGQEPRRGWWQIPGGYCEHDEQIDHAVVREVYEETGVRATVRDVLGLRNSLGSPSTNVYVIFRLDLLEGDPRFDGDEITGCAFYSLREIAEMEKVQSLSKWAISAALTTSRGFEAPFGATDLVRPGYVLFGAAGHSPEETFQPR